MHIRQGYMLDKSIPQTGGIGYKLSQARALVETHKALLKIRNEIMGLCPSLKGHMVQLTDYSAEGMDTYPTFASRLHGAQRTLMLAKQFKGSDIPLQEYEDVSNFLRQHDTQDALTDILLKHGDDIGSIRSGKNAEWNALVYKIEKQFSSMESASLQKALFNEMSRLQGIYDQSILSSSPVDVKATLEQRIVMAEFFREFAELGLDTKHTLKPDQIMQKVFEKNPALAKKLTPKQKELIKKKLGELDRHYAEINKIKKMTPAEKRAYVVGKIKKEYPNSEVPADLQFKIHFGGETGSTIYMHFSRSTFIQLQYSRAYPHEKWSSLTSDKRQKILNNPKAYGVHSFGALNIGGNLVFVNSGGRPLTERNYKMEMHEDVHALTFLSGAKDSPKWSETHYAQLLNQGKYEEYVKLRFQEEFTGVCDEITAKIIEGETPDQIMESFERTYWKHYTTRVMGSVPIEHRHKIQALYTKTYREFRTMFKRSLYFGEKIKSYPNGENILRFTPPQKWEAMYKHLKVKHGYDALVGNIEQTLPVAREAVYKCRSGNLYIYAGSKRHDIVKDEHGFALVRNGQYIDLVDGEITAFRVRRGAPATMEIRVEGDRIFITNLSNTTTSIEVFENIAVESKIPKESQASIE